MFLSPQKILELTSEGILNFGSIIEKSLAHPHVARNGILKFQKTLTKLNFLVFVLTKKLKLIRGSHFEFQ